MFSLQKSMSAWKRARWPLVGALWLASVLIGLTLISRYDFAAGAAGLRSSIWPTQSRVPLSDHGYTLVLFAHPRCPCTRASLEELEKLLARCPNTVSSSVVFFQPSGADDSWKHTDQWATASKIPGVQVFTDLDGVETRLFKAETSGHTMLFDPSGQLLFSGGITISRGHPGDNDGRSAIEAILTNSKPNTCEAPVYGCPIIPPTAAK